MNPGGALKEVHEHEGLGHRSTHQQNAVVFENHPVFVCQCGDQSRLFLRIEGQALVSVATESAHQAHGGLRAREQVCPGGCKGLGPEGVQVEHTGHVRPGRMDAAMNRKAAGVDGCVAAVDHRALHIHLHEVGGSDLLELKAETVEQVVPMLARNRCRDVGPDQVIPTPVRRQAVGGSKIAVNISLCDWCANVLWVEGHG